MSKRVLITFTFILAEKIVFDRFWAEAANIVVKIAAALTAISPDWQVTL